MRRRVAWMFAFLGSAGISVAACGPTIRPDGPGEAPDKGTVGKPVAPNHTIIGAQVVVGQMCPQGAGGRPAVAPLLMKTVSWTDSATDLANAVERGAVQRFAVYGVDGKVAGVFDTLGLADVAPGVSVASGTYVGSPPCTSDGGAAGRLENAACGPAATGCGIAVGVLSRADDPPELPTVTARGVCLQGDALAVDIDGDGVLESFSLEEVLDGARGPAEEWPAGKAIGAACSPTFSLYGVKLAPTGDPREEKHLIGLDVLGVLDLDGDDRVEVVVALRFPTVKTIAVYTSIESPQRLELAGEGQAF